MDNEWRPLPHVQRPPRAMRCIFDRVLTCESFSYQLKVSYLEIYKEELKDLLGTDGRGGEDGDVGRVERLGRTNAIS